MNDEITALIFLALIGVILLAPFALSLRRIPGEKKLKSIYEDRAFIVRTFFPFLFGANIPWWRLSFYDDFMIITAGIKPQIIHYNKIKTIEYKKSFLSKKMHLEYRSADGMSSLYLFPRSPEKILKIIQEKQTHGEQNFPADRG